MYVPKAFQEDDLKTLHTFMQRYNFATLISQQGGAPFASHLPVIVRPDIGPYGMLVGHMARGNSQWHDLASGTDVLAIFHGPHAYISPSWYVNHPAVPTWNYAVVHAYGTPRVIDKCDKLYAELEALVETYESGMPEPWVFDLPDQYVCDMLKGIVGFAIRITRLEGKYKLNQNRKPEDRRRVIDVLKRRASAEEHEVAALMQAREGLVSEG